MTAVPTDMSLPKRPAMPPCPFVWSGSGHRYGHTHTCWEKRDHPGEHICGCGSTLSARFDGEA